MAPPAAAGPSPVLFHVLHVEAVAADVQPQVAGKGEEALQGLPVK